MSAEVAMRRQDGRAPRPRRPRRPGHTAGTTLRYAVLTALSVAFLFPFWWLVTSSLKGPNEIFRTPPTLLPESPRWHNYVDVFTFQPFARQLLNSVYLAVIVTVGVLLISALAGYAFARFRFRGRSVLFVLLLSALMMPAEVMIVPLFSFVSDLGLTNTHIPLVLIPMLGPQAVFGTFLMRQFYLSIPREPAEAGMIDGLGHFGVFWRISLPMVRPALGALGIVSFLYSWNLLLEPLVFVDDVNLFTVPLGLNSYVNAHGLPVWHVQLAATTISVVPMFVAFLVARRQLVESFAMSAVKG